MEDCFLIACSNNDINVISYLAKNSEIYINSETSKGANYLLYACAENINLSVVQYLIEVLKVDKNHKDIYGLNCLMYACQCR
jgi:hypothetical protein